MESFDFDKIAKISHLEFDEHEKERFIKDMQEMLSLAESICALDDEPLPEIPTLNVIPLSPDEESTYCGKTLILQSKRNDGTFVAVPSSIE